MERCRTWTLELNKVQLGHCSVNSWSCETAAHRSVLINTSISTVNVDAMATAGGSLHQSIDDPGIVRSSCLTSGADELGLSAATVPTLMYTETGSPSPTRCPSHSGTPR